MNIPRFWEGQGVEMAVKHRKRCLGVRKEKLGRRGDDM